MTAQNATLMTDVKSTIDATIKKFHEDRNKDPRETLPLEAYVSATSDECKMIELSLVTSGRRKMNITEFTVGVRYANLPRFDNGKFDELIMKADRDKQKDWMSFCTSKVFALDLIETRLREMKLSDTQIRLELMKLDEPRSRTWLVPKFITKETGVRPVGIPSAADMKILQLEAVKVLSPESTVKRGDVIRFLDYGIEDNNGTSIWDGKNLVALDTVNNSVGHVPASLPINEFGRVDYFGDSLNCYDFVYFNHNGYTVGKPMTDKGRDGKTIFYAPVTHTDTKDVWYLTAGDSELLNNLILNFGGTTKLKQYMYPEVESRDWFEKNYSIPIRRMLAHPVYDFWSYDPE
jgi:hypothetical protein